MLHGSGLCVCSEQLSLALWLKVQEPSSVVPVVVVSVAGILVPAGFCWLRALHLFDKPTARRLSSAVLCLEVGMHLDDKLLVDS